MHRYTSKNARKLSIMLVARVRECDNYICTVMLFRTHYGKLRSLHTLNQTPAGMAAANYTFSHSHHTTGFVFSTTYRSYLVALHCSFAQFIISHHITSQYFGGRCSVFLQTANVALCLQQQIAVMWKGEVIKCYNNKGATGAYCSPVKKSTD